MTKEAVQLSLPGFEQAHGRWRAEYNRQIGTDRVIKNRSRIEIKPLYTPRDWNGDAFLENLGFPGQYPYTRGIYPTMHRGRTWTQRQLIGLGTPEDYNKRVRVILDAGATAISLLAMQFRLPRRRLRRSRSGAARHLRHGDQHHRPHGPRARRRAARHASRRR